MARGKTRLVLHGVLNKELLENVIISYSISLWGVRKTGFMEKQCVTELVGSGRGRHKWKRWCLGSRLLNYSQNDRLRAEEGDSEEEE